MTPKIRPGDTFHHPTFGGGARITVTRVFDDIRTGRPLVVASLSETTLKKRARIWSVSTYIHLREHAAARNAALARLATAPIHSAENAHG